MKILLKTRTQIILMVTLALILQLPAYSQNSKTIVISNFENKGLPTDGKDYSIWIANKIQEALVKSPYITVVERQKMKNVLNEQMQAQTGIIDEATAIKAGKIVGAQKILLGEYQCNDRNRYTISARLVDIEKGIIDVQRIASDIKEKEIKNYIADVASSVISEIKNLVALENITRLGNTNSRFNIKVSTKKNTYFPGEMLRFTIETEKDCYIFVFDIGTSGKIHLLYPNKNQPNNFAKAGEKIQIENIRVGLPSGKEIVKAIATLDSVSFDKMLDLASSRATFHSLGNDANRFSRDLEVLISPLANDRWTTDTITLEIKER